MRQKKGKTIYDLTQEKGGNMVITKKKIKDEIFILENGKFNGLRFSTVAAADRWIEFFGNVPTEAELPNELLALTRQVATLRHELCFDTVDQDTYKLFLRMVDELTDLIFKNEGVRKGDLV